MKWTVYYIVTLTLNVASLFLFHKHININAVSLVPVWLMLLSVFQAYYFHHHREKKFKTAYGLGTDITDAEWAQVTVCMVRSYLSAIPWFPPLIFFFATWVKMFSIALFLVAFAGGGVYYRVRYGTELQKRYDEEKQELQEQKKREELGIWK